MKSVSQIDARVLWGIGSFDHGDNGVKIEALNRTQVIKNSFVSLRKSLYLLSKKGHYLFLFS